MHHIYNQLVTVHAWTPDDYEQWLRTQLVATLDLEAAIHGQP